MLERDTWLLIRPGQCCLGHEHVGLRVIRVDVEEGAEPRFDLVESPGGQQAGQVWECCRPASDESCRQQASGDNESQ
jgi:hypothetical protein